MLASTSLCLVLLVMYTGETDADPDLLQSAAEAVRDDGQLAAAVCDDLFHDLLLRSYIYHCLWSVITQ